MFIVNIMGRVISKYLSKDVVNQCEEELSKIGKDGMVARKLYQIHKLSTDVGS